MLIPFGERPLTTNSKHEFSQLTNKQEGWHNATPLANCYYGYYGGPQGHALLRIVGTQSYSLLSFKLNFALSSGTQSILKLRPYLLATLPTASGSGGPVCASSLSERTGRSGAMPCSPRI
jgi:hypothetical protein